MWVYTLNVEKQIENAPVNEFKLQALHACQGQRKSNLGHPEVQASPVAQVGRDLEDLEGQLALRRIL